MDTKSRNELRPLKAYALTTTVLLTVLSLAAFTRFGQKPRFEEIDVERVNVVERDGTLRLVISNKARAPDAVVSGKSYPRSGGNRAGLIFFNDDGNENGGLIYGGRRDRDGTFHAEAGLLFDQFDQDQAAGITYDDENGRRRVGFQVWDRATVPLGELMARLTASGSSLAPPGPRRSRGSRPSTESTPSSRHAYLSGVLLIVLRPSCYPIRREGLASGSASILLACPRLSFSMRTVAQRSPSPTRRAREPAILGTGEARSPAFRAVPPNKRLKLAGVIALKEAECCALAEHGHRPAHLRRVRVARSLSAIR